MIRPADPSDAAAIAAIYAPAVLTTVSSFEVDPPDEDEIARRMLSAPRFPWLVAVLEEIVVGYAYASLHGQRACYRWSADSSVYLARSHWGRGLGRQLYERLVDELRTLGYVSLFAGITLPNPNSVGLHTAIGFRSVGVYPTVGHKFGAWHDVEWWVLPLIDPAPAEPAPPDEWTPMSR